jgi:hypothetical protein
LACRHAERFLVDVKHIRRNFSGKPRELSAVLVRVAIDVASPSHGHLNDAEGFGREDFLCTALWPVRRHDEDLVDSTSPERAVARAIRGPSATVINA